MTADIVSAMPTWDGFLVHVLTALKDGEDWSKAALVDETADIAGVTADQRLETIQSGQERFRNRIGWALSSLVRAEAVERPRRATYRITDVGRDLVANFPGGFGEPELRQIPAYRDYVPGGKTGPPAKGGGGLVGGAEILDPREQIEAGVEKIHGDVGLELLRILRAASPLGFEHLVLALLVAMGYGGSAGDRARHIGGSGDGGVDGVIDQDPLGLGRIYVQAKRYGAENVVGRPAVQGFVGALQGQQAHQGVFITTSTFSKEAIDYARQVSASVVLIDGKRLTQLMIEYRVGVQVEQTYTVVKVDEDYFELETNPCSSTD